MEERQKSLQKYMLIPLDIFVKYQQNRDIKEREMRG